MILGFHLGRAWLAVLAVFTSLAAGAAVSIPNLAEGAPSEETAVFAGGCSGGSRGSSSESRASRERYSGYAGGSAGSAQYEAVSRGTTGHAESVQVTFDPVQVPDATLPPGVLQRGP